MKNIAVKHVLCLSTWQVWKCFELIWLMFWINFENSIFFAHWPMAVVVIKQRNCKNIIIRRPTLNKLQVGPRPTLKFFRVCFPNLTLCIAHPQGWPCRNMFGEFNDLKIQSLVATFSVAFWACGQVICPFPHENRTMGMSIDGNWGLDSHHFFVIPKALNDFVP